MMHSSSCVYLAACKQQLQVSVSVCFHSASVGVDHVSKRFTGGLQGSSSTERWRKDRQRFKYLRGSNCGELSNSSFWEDPSKASLSNSLHRFTQLFCCLFPHPLLYFCSFFHAITHIPMLRHCWTCCQSCPLHTPCKPEFDFVKLKSESQWMIEHNRLKNLSF